MRRWILIAGVMLAGCDVSATCTDLPKLDLPSFPQVGQQLDVVVHFDTDRACVFDPAQLTLLGQVSQPDGEPQTPQVTFDTQTDGTVHFTGHILFTPTQAGSYFVRGLIQPSVREFGVSFTVL